MNYIIEDNFDFFNELKEGELSSPDLSMCMISHTPLTFNSVTLSCKHTFNYLPLYNELYLHNNRQYIVCPYCRKRADKLLPFLPLAGVSKIYGVNYPPKLCMALPKCSFIAKNGMYKGSQCQNGGVEYAHGLFCLKHANQNINSAWTAEKELLSKTKSVPELRAMLRIKGLKVGGVKKELVNRLIDE